MRVRVRIATAALAAALVLAQAACDGKDGPSNAPGGGVNAAGGGAGGGGNGAPAAFSLDGTPESSIDDDVVVRAVASAARTGAPLPSALAKLPPRVSPCRVAVRALHDHLTGVPGAAADWTKLLDALDDLARGERTKVDAGALAPLVAAWRRWTPEERAAETKLASRCAKWRDVIVGNGPVDVAALGAAVRDLPKGPPMSPAYASCLALRAVHAALETPGEDAGNAVAGPLDVAGGAFDAIGWPGGAGPFFDAAARRLEAKGKTTIRAIGFTEAASGAYSRSGDALRIAMIRFERAKLAYRDGDVGRAARLADTAAQAIEATGTRGEELTDSFFLKGLLALAAGKPESALADLDRARKEVVESKANLAQLAGIERLRATALWFLGRYDDAIASADAGVKAFADNVREASAEQVRERAELDEIAARALVEAGRPADAAARHRRAAEIHSNLPGGGPAATLARLNAADAVAKSGNRDAARKLVDEVLAAPGVSLGVHAEASRVLRALGDLDGAERELAAAEKGASPEAREALSLERGRLAAARKDFDGARRWFGAALERATRGVRPGDSAGPQAAEIALEWARAEYGDGDLEEATRLAAEAITHFAAASNVVELERARKLWTDCVRQRLDFSNAESAAAIRVKSGPPGTYAMKLDAAIDLFLARVEQFRAGRAENQTKLDEAILALPEGGIRTAAKALAFDDATQPVGEVQGRAMRLLEAAKARSGSVEGLLSLAARLPSEEPELRRWALRQVAARPEAERKDVDWAQWLDRFRGADPRTSQALRAALGAQDRFVAFEPLGRQTLVLTATAAAGVRAQFADGDAGLGQWWKAARDDPAGPRLSEQSLRLATTVDVVREALAPKAGQRLLLSTARPYGPLPADLLSTRNEGGGGATMFVDQWEVGWVRSPSDLVTAASRSADATLPVLRGADSPLRTRHAVVALLPVDAAVRARFTVLVEEERTKGLDASAAVRAAKIRMRDEWKPDPRMPTIPVWACFALRGAP